MAETEADLDVETDGDLWGYGQELVDHLKKPWAMVVRVRGMTHYGDGEPTGEHGEAIVRLVNVAAHSMPKALAGVSPINLALGYPWVTWDERANDVVTLGGIMLTSKTARVLGEALVRAARIVEHAETDQ